VKNLPAGQVRQVKIEEDQIRGMLARELEADPALHGGDELEGRPFRQRLLDQGHIRKVVFNIQNSASDSAREFSARSRDFLDCDGLERRLGSRKFQPEGAAVSEGAIHADAAMHRLDEPLTKREPKTRTFDGGLLRAEAIERGKESRYFFRGN